MRLEYVWYALLPAVPAAVLLRWLDAGPLVTFPVAGLGVVPLAAFLGRATDSLAGHVGPRFGGLLSASFGNAAESIIGLLALGRGLTAVVKASLTGSIIGNALFVMGLSLMVGGLRHGRQRFDRVNAGLRSALLVLAGIGLTVPTVLYHTLGPDAEVRLSEEVAVVFFATYVLNLAFSLFGRRAPEEDEVQRRGVRGRPSRARQDEGRAVQPVHGGNSQSEAIQGAFPTRHCGLWERQTGRICRARKADRRRAGGRLCRRPAQTATFSRW